MKNWLLIVVALVVLGWPTVVSSSASTNNLCVNVGGTGGCYSSIQAAVNNANPGDTINVAAGTYTEQVVVSKTLTLIGAGVLVSTIQAPATLPPSSSDDSTIIKITGYGIGVEVSGFTITGPGPSSCGSILAGIYVQNGAYANIHDNRIMDIRDNPFSGCQNGVAVLIGRQLSATTATVDIVGNVISGYQKNAITVDNSGSSASISGNQLIGVGPTNIITQNGIQISRGATGTISGNIVSNHSYTPLSWVSTGILLYEAGLVQTNQNTISQNQVGIYNIGGSGNHNANNISATAVGTGSPGGFWGLVVDDPPRARQPNPLDGIKTSTAGKAAESTLISIQTVTVTNNTLIGDQSAKSVGIEIDGGLSAATIAFTATNNYINQWGTSVAMTLCPPQILGCAGGGIASVNLNYNHLGGNTVALYNQTPLTIDATRNWWGATSGPIPGEITFPAMSTFNPWLCAGNDLQPSLPGFQQTGTYCYNLPFIYK